MEQSKNFIVTSNDKSIHVILPIKVSPDDWQTVIANAMVMASQEFVRADTGCPCCVVDSIREVLGGAIEHFREINLLENGTVIASEQAMENEDYLGVSRAVMTTIGLAILSEGEIPKFIDGKDVMVSIDDIRFSRYPLNHDNTEKAHSVVH